MLDEYGLEFEGVQGIEQVVQEQNYNFDYSNKQSDFILENYDFSQFEDQRYYDSQDDQFKIGESLNTYYLRPSQQLNQDINSRQSQQGFYNDIYDLSFNDKRKQDCNQIQPIEENNYLLLDNLNLKGSSNYLDVLQYSNFNNDNPNYDNSHDNFFDDIDAMLPNAKGKVFDNLHKNSEDGSTQDNSFNSNEIEEEIM